MRFAYADPPYLGQGSLYAADHPDALDWNDLSTHKTLIERLISDYPDGWLLSASSQSLRSLLPLCPEDIRVLAWVKPFAAFKKHVNPSHAWEPILFSGGRPRTDEMTYIRDWVSWPITLKKGLVGAKPWDVCMWMFDVLNAQDGDTLDDLYPGTGVVTEAWKAYMAEPEVWASRINRVKTSWEMGKGRKR